MLAWLQDPVTKVFLNIIFRQDKFVDIDPEQDNWAVKQAHMNGRKYTLKRIQELVTHE